MLSENNNDNTKKKYLQAAFTHTHVYVYPCELMDEEKNICIKSFF